MRMESWYAIGRFDRENYSIGFVNTDITRFPYPQDEWGA